MYPTILALLVAFVTMALAAPLAPLYPTHNATLCDPSNSTSTDLIHTLDANQCLANKNHYPAISMWEQGMNQFCDSYGNQKVYWDHPLTITITLTGHNKKPIDWIYKVTVDNENPPGAAGPYQWNYYPSIKGCKDKFMGFTKDKGGGLGKAYCNWDSSKLNIHDKLMLGGKYEELLNPEWFATVTWETRPKKGQKGV